MAEGASRSQPGADKLQMFSSPELLRRNTDDSNASTASGNNGQDNNKEHDYDDEDDGLPKFRKYEQPTLLEIFYDLVFAANYEVFSNTQQVTNHARFKAYTGYFCLLWLSWFVVVMFDVRYVTDSIFSRFTRALQLGVLVGFAVVSPKFEPSHQNVDTMKTMSLILMFSRACLALEYGTVAWHLRRYCAAVRRPLYIQILIHAIAAIIYLGVTFAFHHDDNSHVFVTWYVVSGVEGIVCLLVSNISRVVSITRSHIMVRITLLTVMILGNGIVSLAREITTIVQNPYAWDAVTIGLVTAGVAAIYFIFLTYFDWLRSSYYLPRIRQQLWVAIHLPFHLSLVLFMQGFTQYLIWSKIITQYTRLTDISDPTDDDPSEIPNTSLEVQAGMNSSIHSFFADYPPHIGSTWETVNAALANLTQIPDTFWHQLKVANDAFYDNPPSAFTDNLDTLQNIFVVLAESMANALFAAFGINISDDLSKTGQNSTQPQDIKSGGFQLKIQDATWDRYRLVFAYGYVSCGITMFLMLVLTMIAHTTPYKPWPIVRVGIIFLLALGTAFTATLWFNEDASLTFLLTPWVLPTITLVWTIMLFITHINGKWTSRQIQRLRYRRRQKHQRHTKTKDEHKDDDQRELKLLSSWHQRRTDQLQDEESRLEEVELGNLEVCRSNANSNPREPHDNRERDEQLRHGTDNSENVS